MSKVKVLHTDNSHAYTGAFKALFEYIVSESDRVESIVILPKGSQCVIYLKQAGIKHYELPFIEIRKNLWTALFYFPCLFINGWRIKRIATKERIDVFHSNDLYNLSLYIVKYFFRYKAPLVTHLRLMPSSYTRLLYNIWKKIHLNYSNEIVAVSRAVKRAYNDSPKIHVVYDMYPSKEKHPSREVIKRTVDNKIFRFLYLANYTRGKGQEYAIEAFDRVVAINHKCSLTFAGGVLGKPKNEKYKAELMKMAEAKGLSSKIIFENFIQDVELKMKEYDCLLNFSLSESFSFTSYEALRFGIPLLVTDCGGPSELFENNKSGILINNGDTIEMTKAMLLISTDIELQEKLSRNSRIHIESLTQEMHRFDYLSNLFCSAIG